MPRQFPSSIFLVFNPYINTRQKIREGKLEEGRDNYIVRVGPRREMEGACRERGGEGAQKKVKGIDLQSLAYLNDGEAH